MRSNCEIEFWFFNTQIGFHGPFLAKRDETDNPIVTNMPATAPALEQKKPVCSDE
jgi:hypothetical protein